MSQQALSSRIGNSRSWTLRWESGRRCSLRSCSSSTSTATGRASTRRTRRRRSSWRRTSSRRAPPGRSSQSRSCSRSPACPERSQGRRDLRSGVPERPDRGGRHLPGQQITTADLSVTTSKAVPTTLTGFERGVAIPVDPARGLVGYTQQGDHVDVYVSLAADQGNLLTLLAPNVEIVRAPTAGQSTTYV